METRHVEAIRNGSCCKRFSEAAGLAGADLAVATFRFIRTALLPPLIMLRLRRSVTTPPRRLFHNGQVRRGFNMKTLLTFSLCLLAIVAHAANPSTKSFRATGGLVVTSNDVTGIITYDGSTNAPASSTSAGRGMSNLVWSAVLSVDSTNGTNATAIRGDISKPWRDVRTAMAASQSGDTIWVRNGIHDVGSNTLIVLPGRKLIGQGFGSVIRGLGALDMDGPIVVPGSTSEVAHLTIEHGNLNDYKGATFGFQWVATNGPTFGPTNAVIHDVLMRGDTDCIYLRSTNYWDITAWNIHTLAAFDSLVQFSESSNGVSRWNNCFFKADLKGSVNDYSVTSGNASAVKIQGGVAEFIACSAIGTNGNLVTRGLVAVGGVTRWIGGSIEAAGTNDVLAASRETAATFIYSGNQLRVEDIGEGVTGSTIYGSQQTVISNITQVPGSSGLVIKTTDPFFTDYVFFSLAGGVNIGALTDPGAARLQVGSLPGSGDYVAADGNGLLFSTNAPAGSGGAFGADGLVQYANNGTNKAEAAFSYDEGDDSLTVSNVIAQVLQIYDRIAFVASNVVDIGTFLLPGRTSYVNQVETKGINVRGGAAGSIALSDTDASHAVSFVAAGVMSSNIVFTFPTGVSNGYFRITSVTDSNFTVTFDTPAGGGSLETNDNQFGASTTLTIKDAAAFTNSQEYGVLTLNGAVFQTSGGTNVNAFFASNYFAGLIQYAAGTPAVGEVLVTDAAGNATWESSITNLNKLSLGTFVDAGAQNPSITLGGTNSAGTATAWQVRNTNGLLTFHSPLAPFATAPLTLTTNGNAVLAGTVTATSVAMANAGSLTGGTLAGLLSTAAGWWRVSTAALNGSGGLVIGATASDASPAIGSTNGHLNMMGGSRLYGTEGTNALLFAALISTTVGTATNSNTQAGRVRIVAASQSYFVTNSLVTANSVVLATVNSSDATGYSVAAIPTAGLLELKLNGVATGNADISWFIARP